MIASASEAFKSPGANVPCSIDLILVELREGRYVGPILQGTLADLLAGQRMTVSGGSGSVSSSVSGGGKGSSGRTASKTQKVGASGGG